MRTLALGRGGGISSEAIPPAVTVVTRMRRTLSLFLQSVSALVDKFKKNDQVFDINAEIEDSDGEEVPDGPLEDDFDANDEPDHTASGDHAEFRSWRDPCRSQSCQ